MLLSNANTAKMDPSRTTMLRRSFIRRMNVKFARLKAQVMKFVAKDDELALKPTPTFKLNVKTFEFRTSTEKLDGFNSWFKEQVDSGVLTVDGVTGESWTSEYVGSAYKKGIERAYLDVNKKTSLLQTPDFYEGNRKEFLRSAFFAPETTDKLKLIYSRTFEELKGVTASMSQQMSRTLAEGLARGDSPLTVARQMTKQIDKLTRTRARAIARTEIIRAHAEGQLDGFTKLGVEEVGIMAEWQTANDAKVCEECASMEGQLYNVEEAHGLLPLHPNCRCAWVPATTKETKDEYRLPTDLPDTSEVSELLAQEKVLRVKVAQLRKAYKGGQRELRKDLLKYKAELKELRNKIDAFSKGGAPG